MVERAFALAQGGQCENLPSLREQLRAEDYLETGHLHGITIRNQLKKLIIASKALRDADG